MAESSVGAREEEAVSDVSPCEEENGKDRKADSRRSRNKNDVIV